VITKYGYTVVLTYSLIALLILILSFFISKNEIITWIIRAIVILFIAFLFYFFRDPERTSPTDDYAIISPADGKIVLIKNLFEDEYLHQEAVQVSIFMSPLNVHVNRFPISGKIGYFKYYEGKYLVAFNEKSSEVNERTHIGIENKNFKLLFKQIAGTIARRIIAPITIGQEVKKGERFGMIRFGSRIDLIVPSFVEIIVKLGEKVKGGETIIARIPETMKGISI